MSASTSGYNPPGGWSWPQDFGLGRWTGASDDDPSNSSKYRQREDSSQPSKNARAEKQQQEHQRRHYKPRTCRICLETVMPTFHPPSENLPGAFQGKGYVSYDSEDGRLISPCKCKGSSRYVHDTCLQEWRHADPGYGKRNFWQCPTCGFKYRLERMRWGRWISSKATQIGLTLVIFLIAIFLLGFVADPIINLYVDPLNTIASAPLPSQKNPKWDDVRYEDDDSTWGEHFVKGFASLGVLGFVKMFFSLSPWHWLNWRGSGLSFGSGGRAGTTGRDRAANISWVVLIVGVCTFLYVSSLSLISVNCKTQVMLTSSRPFGKAFVHGAVVCLRRQARE